MADHDLILRLEYALNRSGDPWGWVVNVTPCPCRATGMPDNDCRDEAVVDLGCGELRVTRSGDSEGERYLLGLRLEFTDQHDRESPVASALRGLSEELRALAAMLEGGATELDAIQSRGVIACPQEESCSRVLVHDGPGSIVECDECGCDAIVPIPGEPWHLNCDWCGAPVFRKPHGKLWWDGESETCRGCGTIVSVTVDEAGGQAGVTCSAYRDPTETDEVRAARLAAMESRCDG